MLYYDSNYNCMRGKMKKILLCFFIVIGVVGCSEHDQEYYFNHIDKAKEKVQECKAQLKEAMVSRNKVKFTEILKDNECNAAQNAVAEFKISQRKKK